MDIFDIANLAGVSRKTVQRVLNQSPQVKPETRNRILKIMDEHQYHPNVSARRLVKKKTRTIGLFIIQDPEKHDIYSDDLFYSVVIGSMIRSSSERGYNVLVTTTNVTDPAPILKLYREKSIDAGMIISWTNVQTIVDQIISAGFIVGLFDQNNVSERHPNVPIPLLCNEEGAKIATNYLIELGHKDIGIITGEEENPAAIERLSGYLDALKEGGIQDQNVFKGRFVEQAGYEAVHYWISQKALPTAIVCSNDLIAFGALKALNEAGLSVPDNVSLIGFDNVLLTQYTTPALTTMNVPRVEMAASLVEQLVHQIEDEPMIKPPSFQATLIKRNSCARLN
ncbi:LacI family DNA-binding transcriptional regulator [Jeotgalibacillus proteolyticus]|uniref:LacI family DNA-binding transcriptional regulator n=1 Tax=Jeotgalibacillus proteolyticus TaxID=2082395 RepID=UPI003CEADC07